MSPELLNKITHEVFASCLMHDEHSEHDQVRFLTSCKRQSIIMLPHDTNRSSIRVRYRRFGRLLMPGYTVRAMKNASQYEGLPYVQIDGYYEGLPIVIDVISHVRTKQQFDRLLTSIMEYRANENS